MWVYVTNTFIQTKKNTKTLETVITKSTGALVDIPMKLDPEHFKGYVVYEKGWKIIYMVVLREIYGMMVA